MNKIENINLSGRAYQLEEQAYEALAQYLESARHKLADDPDKEEVMRDFEQAIAEKCDALLNEHKNVITTAEMKRIIKAMGPVQADTADESTVPPEEDIPPKRLYTLQEGSVIGGVCTGMAAYFNIDVTIMRVIFVILGFVTSGFWILVYLLLMFIIPEAKTPEQKAELRGERFSAQDLLDRARQKYSEVGTQEHWKKVAQDNKPALTEMGKVVMQILRLLATTMATILSIIAIILTVAWIMGVRLVVQDDIALTDELRTISPWAIMGGLTALYTIFVVPLVSVTMASYAFGRDKVKKVPAVLSTLLGVLWMIALTALICISIVIGGRVADYQRSHGYIQVNGRNTLCINANFCQLNRVE